MFKFSIKSFRQTKSRFPKVRLTMFRHSTVRSTMLRHPKFRLKSFISKNPEFWPCKTIITSIVIRKRFTNVDFNIIIIMGWLNPIWVIQVSTFKPSSDLRLPGLTYLQRLIMFWRHLSPLDPSVVAGATSWRWGLSDPCRSTHNCLAVLTLRFKSRDLLGKLLICNSGRFNLTQHKAVSSSSSSHYAPRAYYVSY